MTFETSAQWPTSRRRSHYALTKTFGGEYWRADFPLLENCTWPGKIPYLALTSGTTTGVTKYIPFTREMMAANSRAGLDLLALHTINMPHSKVCAGKTLMLGGSTDLTELAPGVYSGDLSGIAAHSLPAWVRPWSLPSRDVALMKDWEKKISILAAQALEQHITAISGVPSWLNLFFSKMAELKGVKDIDLGQLLPHLQLLVHGGISFAPYLRQYQDFLADSKAEMREVYPASEGFIGIADRGYNQGLRLCLEHGLFYEFVPVEDLPCERPARHWIETVETEVNYAVVVSSRAGLWSYIIGDTVRFVDRDPPRLMVTGRLSYSLSVFGEHLIGEEIETALAHAAAAVNCSINDFSVGAEVPEKPHVPGNHVYLVEFSKGILSAADQSKFVQLLDQELCRQNADYEAHRAAGYGLARPRLVCMMSGSFEAWMKDRGKLGGQHKVPRVITDPDLFASLEAYAPAHGSRK